MRRCENCNGVGHVGRLGACPACRGFGYRFEAIVHVCPERDIECGDKPALWCRECPKNAAFEPATRKDTP